MTVKFHTLKLFIKGHTMEIIKIKVPDDFVVCDICSEATSNDKSGGFLFGSKGVCPDCAPRLLAKIKVYNEEYAIKAKCDKDESFKDFILRMRKLGY